MAPKSAEDANREEEMDQRIADEAAYLDRMRYQGRMRVYFNAIYWRKCLMATEPGLYFDPVEFCILCNDCGQKDPNNKRMQIGTKQHLCVSGFRWFTFLYCQRCDRDTYMQNWSIRCPVCYWAARRTPYRVLREEQILEVE